MKNSHQGWGMLGLMAIDMTDRRILAEYRVSSLVTGRARARLEPQIPGLLPCRTQNQTDGETALACHQAPRNLCCHSPLTALLGPGA